MLDQTNPNDTLNDIVFKNKNRAYGAYELRQKYPWMIGKSMVVGVLIIASGFALSYAYDQVFPTNIQEKPPHTLEPLGTIVFEVPVKPIVKQPRTLARQSSQNVLNENSIRKIVKDNEMPKKDLTVNPVSSLANSNNLGPIGSDNDAPYEPGEESGMGGGSFPILGEPPTPVLESNEIFIAVESAPEFPDGGLGAFGKFLSKNLIYPDEAISNNISGKVILKFTVNKDGSLQDITVQKGVGFGCDEEAIRVLKLSPKWKPGKQSGKPVRVSFSVPIVFSLPSE